MSESQFLLPLGVEECEMVRERLAEIAEVEDVAIAGSVRRRLEVIRNVNVVVVTNKPETVIKKLEAVVAGLEQVDQSLFRGIVRSEVPVLFHLTNPSRAGSELIRATGSAEFVAAAGTLPDARTEREAFKSLGLPFVEPERRENADDLRRKRQPKLVDVHDLRGTFHVHTTWSDGRNSVVEMLTAARAREWEYVGISDHSKNASYAGGLTEEQLKLQQSEIAREEKRVRPMKVFRGTEADILQDGSIDYVRKILSRFDFVVASVHSHFRMQRDEMTERVLQAMDDPHVTFIGHLTGRLLLSREGYTVDFDRIFEKAAATGVMMEINGNPRRLDVDWRHLRRAADRGVVFSIHPDAHSIAEYNAVITGTWVARKGGLSPRQIFNTRSVEEVEEALQARRR